MSSRVIAVASIAFCCASLALASAPARAQAFDPVGAVCTVGGWFSGLFGKACNVGDKALGIGKKLLGGTKLAASPHAQTALGLAAITAWVLGGARAAVDEALKIVESSTSPQLTSSWFSSTYWRIAGIGALLTMPFLFAAAIQALLHSDLMLLLRASFGYLPLALLTVAIATPLAMLLLAATDEMCSAVSAASGHAGTHLLAVAGAAAGALSFFSHSPFLAVLVGLLTAFAALALWIELLMRQAAIYIVVLMLPLAFAAFVWPARRIWAVRAVELLIALILSKFAIVAVLTLGSAAVAHTLSSGPSALLSGAVLMILSTFSPWALVRLLPLAEMASSAAGSLRSEARGIGRDTGRSLSGGESAHDAGTAREADVVRDEHPARDAARDATERLREAQAPDRTPAGVAANGSGGNGSIASLDSVLGATAASASAGAPDVEPEPEGDRTPAERIPGMAPQYQQEDFTWDFRVGTENWPPPSVIPADESDQPAESPSGGAPKPDEQPPADDHDPRPPKQDPGDGVL
jgi:hypothetical protein